MRQSVLALGETMARLELPEHGRPWSVTGLSIGIAGAESNVALAVAHLGVGSTWMGQVGDDDLGSLVLREILGGHVRAIVRRHPTATTGLLVKEHRQGQPSHVRYYRTGSAASLLTATDLDEGAIAEAGVLHLTGITPALGAGPLAAVRHAIQVARAAGTLVSFDVNYRGSLWTPRQARPVLASLVADADIVFAGLSEAALLISGQPVDPPGDPWTKGEASAVELGNLGPGHVVIKLGHHGALGLRAGVINRVSAVPVHVVDPVGAGDAFVGGYLGSFVTGHDTTSCLQTAAEMGAAVCGSQGDWEGILNWSPDPTPADAEVIR